MKKKKILIGLIIVVIILLTLFFVFKEITSNPNYNHTITSLTTSNNECLNKDNICENGTKFDIKVNLKDKYDFYVIKDDGKKITLIMAENIGESISWSSSNTGCSHGPDNLIKNIKESTKDWLNVEEIEYTITDSNNCYEPIVERMRARTLTLEEANKLGCQYFYENTCPAFLASNLDSSSGYWLSTSNKLIDPDGAYAINKRRNLVAPWVITNEKYGLRLVIEVKK